MDFANLEKMKVVDLRNELQTRGLDYKGVKAVLIERLRAHLEGAGDTSVIAPGSPCTPGRRSRRTRSMTRSPSPSPEKKISEPLETLEEEGNNLQEKLDEVKELPKTPEKLEQQPEESPETQIEQAKDIEEEEKKESVINIDNETEIQQTNGAENNEENKRDEDQDAISEPKEDANKESETSEKDVELGDIEEEVQLEAPTFKTENETSQQSGEENNKVSQDKSQSRNPSEDRERSRSRSGSRQHSPSSTRSQSPKPRSSGGNVTSPSKAAEDTATPEDEPSIEDKQFGLSWFDSDLHLRIDPVTFASAKPINHDIYALVWSGARANYGVREGKVCFEVRLSEETNIGRDHAFRDEPFTKGFRVGFSMPSSNLLLGESENSFAYCESGKKATNGEFNEFAKPFQLDDVVCCYLDLDSTPCTIKYTLNGEDLGVAFEFEKSVVGEEHALYPHVLTKGYEYQVNFADNDNLLVNMERKIRKKRKAKKIEEPKEEKDKKNSSNSENDKNKQMQNIDEENWDEDQTTDIEQSQIKDVKGSPDKKELEPNKEAPSDDVEMENKSPTKDDESKDEEKKKNSETIEEEKVTEEQTKESCEKMEETIEKENTVEDEKMEDESKKADKPDEEKAEEEKEAEAKQQDTDSKEEECGPSPSKRQKLETVEEEDEFEEIHPIPREHMSLLPGFELVALIAEEKYIAGPQRPESRKECEVILMVGLPGSGKTTWVLNHLKENPEKRYDVIGPDALIAKMKVDGAPRKSVHKGRFDRIYELCFNVLTSLEDIAIKRRRNFILDQANVYASAQRRKMKGFGDFKRKAVVCIPNEDELKRRLEDKKEKGNAYAMKDSILHGLQANFTLPSLEFGWFDEIVFTDLSGDEAKEEVKKYNEKGKKASNRDKRQRRDNHGNDNRRRYDDRRRYDNRNDNRWNDRRAGGGGGYQGGGGNRWGGGGGGGGGGYRAGGGYRDDRGYGGGSGGGGGGRGYDQRRYSSGPQNWVHNNRNRYDDRSGSRYSTGGGGNRYDSYSGGGAGGSRDYRGGANDNRDYRDRHRGGAGGGSSGGGSGGNHRDNPRSGGSTNQRDFRHGHRDTREDSRGGQGSSKAATTSSNYNVSATSGGSGGTAYDKYNKNNPNSHVSNKYNAYQPQSQSNNWSQYNTQQQNAAAGQQYWNYDMQGYGANQQWQTMDPQQQQQWMSWWQQQGGGNAAEAADPNQYWSQYCYTTPAPSADTAKK